MKGSVRSIFCVAGMVVTGITRCLLANDAKSNRMMIATDDQRRPCGRTQRGRVEIGVAQAIASDPIQGWRRYDATKCTGDPLSGIVGDDDENIRRTLG